MVRQFALAILLLLTLSFVHAETVRGPIVDIIDVESTTDAAIERSLTLDELLAVYFSADQRFLRGLEIEVHVPQIVRSQPGSVAVQGLVSIAPTPERRIMALRGARVLYEPLLRNQRIYFQVPIIPDSALRSSADTVVLDRVVPVESFPLLLSFTEISKAGTIPRDTTEFGIIVRPILKTLGGARLRVVTEAGRDVFPGDEELETIALRINGDPVTDITEEQLLEPGLYSLELISDAYLESSQTFGVERGRISEIQVELARPKATVRIEAPDGAAVYVDGIQLEENTVELDEGEHVALVRIGDYSVSRRFAVARKKSYIISVTLDILVNEVE